MMFQQAGFTLFEAVYSTAECELHNAAIAAVFRQETDAASEQQLDTQVTRDGSVRHRAGAIYAARNILDLYPAARLIWRRPVLLKFLREQLGEQFGLVRGLFFDKPPGETWSLPWHKDLLIAISDDSAGGAQGYSTPRRRAGVYHTEPPVEVLERMVTLRIHLDAATNENGPLRVLPCSHLTGKELRIDEYSPVTIVSGCGDVLAMQPLLVHASGSSEEGTQQNRRVLHLEFAASDDLPGGIKWHTFVGV